MSDRRPACSAHLQCFDVAGSVTYRDDAGLSIFAYNVVLRWIPGCTGPGILLSDTIPVEGAAGSAAGARGGLPCDR